MAGTKPSKAPEKTLRRRRGVFLTEAGRQRYHVAQRRLETGELAGERLSIERLSLEIGLSTKTISRVLNRAMPVDLRSLELLFTSLGMVLQSNDFIRAERLHASHSVPKHRSAFFDRKEQIARLRVLVAERRSITLTGTGGVGKTRLALEFVDRHASDLFDRVAYCDLSVVTDPGLVEATIVAAFGGLPNQRRAASVTIGDIIDNERTLLLLDNCEHVLLRASTIVDDLLRRLEYLVVLATSREALGVEGEVVVRLLPLPLPEVAEGPAFATDALRSPAVALFVDRARSADDDFRFDDQAARHAIEIVSRVQGVPLAIEIAASRVATTALADVSESLRDHLRALESEGGIHGARHRSARALIDWSYELLDNDDRKIFRSLAVFMGSFDERAVASLRVAENGLQVATVVNRLVRKSLLFFDAASAPTRYRMLETVRQYAALKLRENAEADVMRLRHASYFHDMLERAEAQRAQSDERSRFASIAAETDNIREALEWCTTQSDNLHIAAEMCSNLFAFWDARGDFFEGERWLRRVLDCDRCTQTTRARLHEGLALLLYRQGMLDESMDLAKRAYRLYQNALDAPGCLRANNLLGIAALDAGEIETARHVFENNLRDAESAETTSQIVVTLSNLGRLLAEFDGKFEESLELFGRSLVMARSAGMSVMVATAFVNLSESSARLGRFPEAIDFARRGIEEACAIGDLAVSASLALQRAACRIRSSGFAAARNDILAAREAIAKHPYRLKLTYELDEFADVLSDAGRPEGAALLLGSLAAFREGTESEYPRLERRHRDIVSRVCSLGEGSYRPAYVRGKTFALDEALDEATSSNSER